jgi:Polyketide cyclase / dehydrase and lipid transport
MVIEKEIIVNKNIAHAWKVLGTDFANAHVWASPLTHSEGSGQSFNGSDCDERSCDIKGMGKTREKLLKFSNTEHLLSYSVPEGMPSMVKYATNTWQLTSSGQDQSKLKMLMDIQLGGIMGTLMQPILNIMLKLDSRIRVKLRRCKRLKRK